MSRKKWRSVMIVGLLAALTAALMAASTAAASPAAGGPQIIVGSKNFTEEYILGELYSQALAAKGFSVTQKQNIGATEVIDTALTSGKINMYPEYVGEIDQTVFGVKKLPKTAHGWWLLAVQKNKARHITVLNATPFFDVDAIAVLKATAQKYGLKTVADLKKVPKLTVGARPEFKDREEGFKGMQDQYGLTSAKFVSIDQGLTYQALDQKKVLSIDVFSTDPQLASGKYVVLSDPKLIFGVQNVAPEVRDDLLAKLGAKKALFISTVNAVSAKLTQAAILALNSAVVNNKKTPKAVAAAFLKANGFTK